MMWRLYPAVNLGLRMLLMLACVAGFCLVIWLILRPRGHYRQTAERPYSDRPQTEPRRDDALELLRHRLASGEITTEEYDAIKAKLSEGSR